MSKNQMKNKIEEKVIHKNPRKEDENIFKISPIEAVYFKETICVNFQSKKDAYSCDNSQQNGNSKSYIETADKQRGQEFSITPRFNFDSKYYTSCFIIPYEGEESDDEMIKNHNNKTIESEKEIESSLIYVPKPKSRNQYCAVCRSHYEDYLSHIGTLQHKKSIKKSKFNNDIEYLTILIKQRMKSTQKDGVMTRSAKRKLEIQGSDYIELELKGSKKRKAQAPAYLKSNSKDNQEKEDPCADAQTPFNKKWHIETTAKSIFSLLD